MSSFELNPIEVLGFVSGVINVWLLARQNIWNWPMGIANNGLYLTVFLRSGLYGDAGLQFVFLLLAIYGWWNWSQRATSTDIKPLRVQRTTSRTWAWLVPATLAAAFGLRWFLAHFTDSTVPGWDGLTTAISLAATYGQVKKLLESWWLWILADLIYIPLYLYKDLKLTSALYVIFLILCVIGWREWRRAVA